MTAARAAVAVVGAAARTPLGRSLAASAAAVRAGISVASADDCFTDAAGDPVVTSRARWLPDDWDVSRRVERLARPAAFEVFAPLSRNSDRGGGRPRVAAFVGAPGPSRRGRPAELDAALERAVSAAAERYADLAAFELIRADHASGLIALERAILLLSKREVDLCLIGGADSYLDEAMIEALDGDGQLRTRSQRFGFTPGEGAAFLLLAPAAVEGLSVLAKIESVATAAEEGAVSRAVEDAEPAEAGAVVTGEALSDCFRRALEGAAHGGAPSWLLGDLNGEPHRADEVGMTLVRVRKKITYPPRVLSPASCWADVGAASAPLGLSLAVASFTRGWGRGAALVWAASDSGQRGAAVIAPP